MRALRVHDAVLNVQPHVARVDGGAPNAAVGGRDPEVLAELANGALDGLVRRAPGAAGFSRDLGNGKPTQHELDVRALASVQHAGGVHDAARYYKEMGYMK